MPDEGRDQCRTAAATTSPLGDIKRVEKHRSFAVWMHKLVSVDPANDAGFILGDEEHRLGPSEKR